MRTIYTVEAAAMNGTVTAMSFTEVYASRELAEQAKEYIELVNTGSRFPVHVQISEGLLYESQEDVPQKVKDAMANKEKVCQEAIEKNEQLKKKIEESRKRIRVLSERQVHGLQHANEPN